MTSTECTKKYYEVRKCFRKQCHGFKIHGVSVAPKSGCTFVGDKLLQRLSPINCKKEIKDLVQMSNMNWLLNPEVFLSAATEIQCIEK